MNTLSSQKKTSSILPVRCIMVAALAVLGITEVLRKKEAWNPTSLNENKDISLEVERSHESTETINKISSYLKSVGATDFKVEDGIGPTHEISEENTMMFEALGELAEKVPDGMNIFDQLPEDKLIRRNFVMFVLWFYLQQEKERVHNWGEYKEGSSHVEKVFSNVACANTAFIRYICLSSRKFSDEEIHFIDDFDFSKAQKGPQRIRTVPYKFKIPIRIISLGPVMVDPSAHIFNAIPLIDTPEKPSDYLLINSVGNGEWFFHGEDYSFEPKNKRYVPVGWERRDYYPIFDLSVEGESLMISDEQLVRVGVQEPGNEDTFRARLVGGEEARSAILHNLGMTMNEGEKKRHKALFPEDYIEPISIDNFDVLDEESKKEIAGKHPFFLQTLPSGTLSPRSISVTLDLLEDSDEIGLNELGTYRYAKILRKYRVVSDVSGMFFDEKGGNSYRVGDLVEIQNNDEGRSCLPFQQGDVITIYHDAFRNSIPGRFNKPMKAGEQVSIRVFPFEFMDDKEEHVVRFDEVSDSFKYQAFFEYWRFEG